MKRKFLFIFLFFIVLTSSFSQNIDSLYSLLDKYNKNPHKALQIIEQIYNLTYQTNTMVALEMSARAIYICDSVLHNPKLTASWKTKLAVAYLNAGQLDQAARYLSDVKQFYQKHKDSINLAKTLMYFGELYHKLKVYQLAIDNLTKAEQIFLRHKKWDDLALVRSKKAFVYNDNYMSDTAFYIIKTSLTKLKTSQKVKAQLYSDLGQLYKNNDQTDSALIYFRKALNIYQKSRTIFPYMTTLFNIGQVFMLKQNYDSALIYLNKALNLAKNINSNNYQAQILSNIALTYFKQNKLSQAYQLFLRALSKAKLAQSPEIKQTCYYYLGQIKEKQNDLKAALNFYKLYMQERNSYYEQIASQGYAEIILMFQNQEKQREIEILKKEEILRTQQLRFLLVVVLLLLILVVVITFMMNKLRKAKKLLEQQYKQIALQKRELESQSRILEKATADLLKQKEKIQRQNQAINASIKYASRIQKAMLPKPEHFAKLFDDFFILFKPKETVSGDFYWLSEVSGEKPSLFKEESSKKIILAVGDCTGHGVPGAFMAMLGDAYLNQIIKVQRIYKPDKILDELNKNIRYTLEQGDTESTDGMDIGICVIDKTERTIEFAGAKMDLIYVQNGKMVRIHGDMYSIGGLKQEKNKKFTSKFVDITTETIFYMYSDGFQDQFGGPYGRKYMAKHFREFLFKIHELRPLDKQKQELEKELARWQGKKYKQMDDITVIGVLIKGKIV